MPDRIRERNRLGLVEIRLQQPHDFVTCDPSRRRLRRGSLSYAAGLSDSAAFFAAMAARSSRTRVRMAILCLRMRLKRAVSPQVLDMSIS